ncbi:hypothetical protein GQR58_026630 [Nymphon striatum]|nr:hypothetical protein GQR58_026630 [Nymphon striatum]
MATEDSKVTRDPEKMEVDDDLISKDSNEKSSAKSLQNDSEPNQQTALEGGNSNLVSKETFNSLTNRLQLLERRLKGPTEDSIDKETAEAEGPVIPQSLNILKAFKYNDSDLQKNSESKKIANSIKADDSQLNSKVKEATTLEDDVTGNDRLEKADHEKDIDKPAKKKPKKKKSKRKKSKRRNPKEEIQKEEIQKEEIQKEEIQKEEIKTEEIQNDEIQKEEKMEVEEPVANESIEAEKIDEEQSQKSECAKDIAKEIVTTETTKLQDTDCDKDSKEKADSKDSEILPKTKSDSENAAIEAVKSESKDSVIKIEDDNASKISEIDDKKCSKTVEENSSDNKVKQDSSTSEGVESNEDNAGEKSTEDSDPASKSDSKDSKDAVVPKKGRGIDAIASMLRKHQVKSDSTNSDNKKSSGVKESSPKSEIQVNKTKFFNIFVINLYVCELLVFLFSKIVESNFKC